MHALSKTRGQATRRRRGRISCLVCVRADPDLLLSVAAACEPPAPHLLDYLMMTARAAPSKKAAEHNTVCIMAAVLRRLSQGASISPQLLQGVCDAVLTVMPDGIAWAPWMHALLEHSKLGSFSLWHAALRLLGNVSGRGGERVFVVLVQGAVRSDSDVLCRRAQGGSEVWDSLQQSVHAWLADTQTSWPDDVRWAVQTIAQHTERRTDRITLIEATDSTEMPSTASAGAYTEYARSLVHDWQPSDERRAPMAIPRAPAPPALLLAHILAEERHDWREKGHFVHSLLCAPGMTATSAHELSTARTLELLTAVALAATEAIRVDMSVRTARRWRAVAGGLVRGPVSHSSRRWW